MSRIDSLLIRNCRQKAVYWGSPRPSGLGRSMTFADPVEIACRWEEMDQIVTDAKGVELTSRAQVFLLQDVDEEGYLFLGTLSDLGSPSGTAITCDMTTITCDNAVITCDASITSTNTDPTAVAGAYIIKRVQKTPALGSTSVFFRKAYLTPSLSFGGF